jgi:hypothetical protein
VTETNGDHKFELVYKWELNKHLVASQSKVSNGESYKMIFYMASENKVVEVGCDKVFRPA